MWGRRIVHLGLATPRYSAEVDVITRIMESKTMSDELVERKPVFGGKVGMLNPEQLKAALGEAAQKDPRGSAPDGSDYMNFSGKRGVYEVGMEKKGIDPEECWLVNVPAFEDGWVCWKENRVAALRLYPLGSPVPTPDMTEHGPFPRDGDGWYQAKSMTIKSIDTGQQAYFKVNAVSAVSVLAMLQKEITERLRAGQPYWPVVKFSSESFMAKGFKNYKPIVTVDGWLNDEQLTVLAEVFEDPQAEIDLDAMYAESLPAKIASPNGEVAKRNRRSL